VKFLRYFARHLGEELRTGGGHINHDAFSDYDSIIFDDDGRLTNASS
jgi:hypothetical protein